MCWQVRFGAFFLPKSSKFAVLLTFFVGTLKPSLLSAVYFVIALLLITWWAMLQPLYRLVLAAI